MAQSVQLPVTGSSLAVQRVEAKAHCQYLSAVARGVARDELLVLGLTRELALLQRNAGKVPATMHHEAPSRGALLSRCLTMFGLPGFA